MKSLNKTSRGILPCNWNIVLKIHVKLQDDFKWTS